MSHNSKNLKKKKMIAYSSLAYLRSTCCTGRTRSETTAMSNYSAKKQKTSSTAAEEDILLEEGVDPPFAVLSKFIN